MSESCRDGFGGFWGVLNKEVPQKLNNDVFRSAHSAALGACPRLLVQPAGRRVGERGGWWFGGNSGSVAIEDGAGLGCGDDDGKGIPRTNHPNDNNGQARV